MDCSSTSHDCLAGLGAGQFGLTVHFKAKIASVKGCGLS